MRRADRLFQIIQFLRSRRLTTAKWLAQQLEVSERTIYRDVRDLILTGVQIEGEAGVGYALRKGYDLPPLMFDQEELTSLVLGARIVQSWGDPKLAKAAEQVLSKVESVIPKELKDSMSVIPIFSPMTGLAAITSNYLQQIRQATDEKRKLDISYIRIDGTYSERTIWPLGLFYWGATWTCGGWCELRNEFRNFRIDRIKSLQLCAEGYPDEPGRRLQDFFEAAKQQRYC